MDASPRPLRKAPSLGCWRAAAAALLALALLPFFGAAGAPSAYILGAELTPIDTNANGLYDYLNISVTLNPPSDGSYLIAATLRWPTTGTAVASASSIASLHTGVGRFTLRVEGPTINEKQLDGPYNLTVDLVSSPTGPVRDRAAFTTPAFRAGDFERSPEEDKPRLNVGQQSVQLSSPSINASVSLTRPAVRWATAPGAPWQGAFEATFPRVVAFSDDGDRAFEPSELACAADLGAGNWSIVELEVGPSTDLGATIRFTLRSAVAFEGAACAPPVSGALDLRFLITQRNGTVGGATPFPILGGLEVKVDMDLSLGAPITASDLAFEVDLRDLSSNLSFLVRGPAGFERLDPAAGTLPVEPLEPGSPFDIERLSFVDEDGVARGHFAWLSIASENLTGGQERFVQVTASRGLENGTLQLFLAAPNDAQLRSLLLDPAVGVAPQPAAPSGGAAPPPPAPERPSLVVFLAALAAVSAMFFFSVYARARKY